MMGDKQEQRSLEENRNVPHVLVSAGFEELLQLGGSYAVQLIENFWLEYTVERRASFSYTPALRYRCIEHINPGCAVPTSLVPLSLMPYLSLVFLIRSEQLLINFFISYSWGKRIQVVQRTKGSFVCFRTNLYAVWHVTQISCSYSKTVTTWRMTPLTESHWAFSLKTISSALKRAVSC